MSQPLPSNALENSAINIKPTNQKMPSTSASFETPSFELEPLKSASSTALSVFRGDFIASPDIAAAHNETDFENSSSEFVVPFERDHEEVRAGKHRDRATNGGTAAAGVGETVTGSTELAICFMRAAIYRAVVLTSARSLLIVLSTIAFALTSNLGQTTSILIMPSREFGSRPAPAPPELEPPYKLDDWYSTEELETWGIGGTARYHRGCTSSDLKTCWDTGNLSAAKELYKDIFTNNPVSTSFMDYTIWNTSVVAGNTTLTIDTQSCTPDGCDIRVPEGDSIAVFNCPDNATWHALNYSLPCGHYPLKSHNNMLCSHKFPRGCRENVIIWDKWVVTLDAPTPFMDAHETLSTGISAPTASCSDGGNLAPVLKKAPFNRCNPSASWILCHVFLIHVFHVVSAIGKRHTAGRFKRLSVGPGKALILVAVGSLLFAPVASAMQQIGDPFQQSAGAVSTLGRLSPVVSEKNVMRTDSTQGSTYQHEEGGGPTSITNKVGSFPDHMATARQEQASSSSFYVPSSSFAVVAHRMLTNCPGGQYQDNGPQSGCNSCPEGSYCPARSSAVTCPEGYYCPSGSSGFTSCPANYYCPPGSPTYYGCAAGKYSAASSSACTNCTAGNYCRGGGHGYTQCPASHYCPAGSSGAIQCPAGYYCTTGSSAYTNACPGGHYCPVGSSWYNACPAGYYCKAGSSEFSNACPGGYYCSAGSSWYNACPAGHYCPPGSATYIRCAVGKFSVTSRSACTSCPSGQYQASSGRADCNACPEGFFCPEGASSYYPAMPTALPTTLTPVPTLLQTSPPTIFPSPLPLLRGFFATRVVLPTRVVSYSYSYAPTANPLPQPTLVPTYLPTQVPTGKPSPLPTPVPTPFPTQVTTANPSPLPTLLPTSLAVGTGVGKAPTQVPTLLPTTPPQPMPSPTAVPTPAPTMPPTLQPSTSFLPTSAPIPAPTTLPTISPSSPLPTVEPTTVGLGIFTLDSESVEAVVAATTAAAAAVVGGSIGKSVGASVSGSAAGGAGSGAGGTGGGTAGSKTPVGNPLMLVFLVQGVFMTSRLSDVSHAYSDMTAGFASFNLEMAPPAWAKGFVMGSRRRVANEQDDFFDDFFNDETDASGLMRSHLFYMSIVIILVLGIHVTIYIIFAFKGVTVPKFFKFPGPEAWVFMALVMGMLDVSAQVLMNEKTAPGWKLVAAIEIVIVLAFLFCIMILGRKFRQVTHWEPTPNVRRLRLADAWKILDRNEDGRVTLAELVLTGPKLGLTKTQATEMFLKLDENKSGAIDRDEFRMGYKLEFVAVELTTPVERLWAYLFEPRRLGGTYTILDPESDKDLKQPSLALFTSFTPFHVHFLAFRIVTMVVESFALGGMHGWSQGFFLSLFSFAVFIKIVRNPPSVLLAQSRADTINAAGRFLIYAIYSMVYPKWLTSSEAAQGMTLVIVLILTHSVYTQLDPLARAAIATLVAMFSGANKTAALPVSDTEDKMEISEVDEEEAQTMATNLDKLPSTAEDDRPQLVNKHIDESFDTIPLMESSKNSFSKKSKLPKNNAGFKKKAHTSSISSQGSPLASRPNRGVYLSPTPRQGSTRRERSVNIDNTIQEHGERTVDTPSGSQGGIRDDGANASTHEAPPLSSMDDLARASSGGGGYFELPKLSRSPHAGAGRRYVTDDGNDATIADDDSTETKFYEHEHRQQLQRSSDGTVSLVSFENLDRQPTSGSGGGGDGIKI